MMAEKKRNLSSSEKTEILSILKSRFEKNTHRHQELEWSAIETKLSLHPEKLWSLSEMERTGGEPDVIGHDRETDEFIFCDCSAESPGDRRSLCYDNQALDARKEFKPGSSAVEMADNIGIDILTQEQYRELQRLGKFDLKTSSWLKTPPEIRRLGGAIFGDRRYDHVFVYHNGASSYYAARGFRGSLRV